MCLGAERKRKKWGPRTESGGDKKGEGYRRLNLVRFGFREEESRSRRDAVGASRAQGDVGVGTRKAKVRSRG